MTQPSANTLAQPPDKRVRFVGVDGCRFGWIAVTRRRGRLSYRLFADVTQLAQAYPCARRILIDMPIGLASAQVPLRPCDRLARVRLGERRSSVFPIPCRAAAHATDIAMARRHNLRHLGRSLSAQAWNISRKISEVDTLMARRPCLAEVFEEMHPELCFMGLGDGSPMRHNKKTPAGIEERLRVLERFEPDIRPFLARVSNAEKRADVGVDDILDAAIGQVAARAPSTAIRRLSGEPARGEPTHDELGLPIRMVFAEGRY